MFEKILTNINPAGFKEIELRRKPILNSFQTTNEDLNHLFDDFDHGFD